MRIFVTGASGFIGRAAINQFLQEGHEVIALSRDGNIPSERRLAVLCGDLAAVSQEWFSGPAIDALVHCAWVATPGEYLASPLNARFVEWSLEFLRALSRARVRRFIGVGTCLECPPSNETLPEEWDFLDFVPDSPYARAKQKWLRLLREWAQLEGVSLAWARLFYPYGPGEHLNRFPSFLIRKLKQGESVVVNTPESIKDYVYITDVAQALGVLAASEKSGAFSSGEWFRNSDRAAGAPTGLRG